MYQKQIPRHKFNAKACEGDGIRFPSKLQRNRYYELKLLQKAGEILFFLREVPIDLPGGVKYRCDFQVFWSNGTVTFEDTKGYETVEFKIKKKQVEDIYPFTITILKARK